MPCSRPSRRRRLRHRGHLRRGRHGSSRTRPDNAHRWWSADRKRRRASSKARRCRQSELRCLHHSDRCLSWHHCSSCRKAYADTLPDGSWSPNIRLATIASSPAPPCVSFALSSTCLFFLRRRPADNNIRTRPARTVVVKIDSHPRSLPPRATRGFTLDSDLDANNRRAGTF